MKQNNFYITIKNPNPYLGKEFMKSHVKDVYEKRCFEGFFINKITNIIVDDTKIDRNSIDSECINFIQFSADVLQPKINQVLTNVVMKEMIDAKFIKAVSSDGNVDIALETDNAKIIFEKDKKIHVKIESINFPSHHNKIDTYCKIFNKFEPIMVSIEKLPDNNEVLKKLINEKTKKYFNFIGLDKKSTDNKGYYLAGEIYESDEKLNFITNQEDLAETIENQINFLNQI